MLGIPRFRPVTSVRPHRLPAISYTAPIPVGVEDAEVLVLGRPEIKDLLYTAYHESAAARQLRLTLVHSSDLIGVYFVLLTLTLKLSRGVSLTKETLDILWEIYHYGSLSLEAYQILSTHVQHLAQLAKDGDLELFNGPVRVEEESTRSQLRDYLVQLSGKEKAQLENISPLYFRSFDHADAEDIIRSSGPLSQQAVVDMRQNTFDGLKLMSKEQLPNFLDEGKEAQPTPWNALTGYHLATAHTPLTETSPWNFESKTGGRGEEQSVIVAAKAQFCEWIKALAAILGKGLLVTLVMADASSYCEALHRLANGADDVGCYAFQGTRKALQLGPSTTTKFDAIDATAVASDRMTTLLTLARSSRLLKDAPWATISTMFILKMGEMRENPLLDPLYENSSAASFLLGVSAAEIVTDANTSSTVDDVLLGIDEDIPLGNQSSYVWYRLSWKQNKHLFDTASVGRVRADAQQMADYLFELDVSMHKAEERVTEYRRTSLTPPRRLALLAEVLDAAAHHVSVVSLSDVGKILLEQAGKGEKRKGMELEASELALALHERGIYSAPYLDRPVELESTRCPVVAVALSFNSSSLDPLLSREDVSDIFFEARVRQGSKKSHVFNSLHLLTSAGGPDSSRRNSIITVTFWVPATVLVGDNVTIEILGMPRPLLDSFYGVTLFSGKAFGGLGRDGEGVVVADGMPRDGSPDGIRFQPRSVVHASVGGLELADGGAQISLQYVEADGTACLVGKQDLRSEKGRALLAEKFPIHLRQRSLCAIDIVFTKKDNEESYTVQFPYAVTTTGSKTRIARKSTYIEVIAPFAAHGEGSPALNDFIFPTRLSSAPNRIPSPMNASRVNLDLLPVLDVSDETTIKWITTLTSFQFSSAERQAREEADKKTGMSSWLRVNLKESLFAMFMTSTGLQGGQTGLFVLSRLGDGDDDADADGGVHIIIVVSAVRLDGSSRSIVLDAAVIVVTEDMLGHGAAMEDFLLVLRTLEICRLDVDDEELRLWKRMLPSLAERCRTWQHDPDSCEYGAEGATVPLSLAKGQPVLCSCGNGKMPANFVALPGWEETASRNAVRVAIGPVFACPFVERTVDFAVLQPSDHAPKCRACGKREGKDLPAGQKLKKCLRCLKVVYCSPQCQKKDWKKHRHECQEVGQHGAS